MQILGLSGIEGKVVKGLEILSFEVKKLQGSGSLRLPHIGWNSTKITNIDSKLFQGVPDLSDYYYVHTYGVVDLSLDYIVATCDYGCGFVSAIECDNIFATQFHPEKSQKFGMLIIKNFISFVERYK